MRAEETTERKRRRGRSGVSKITHGQTFALVILGLFAIANCCMFWARQLIDLKTSLSILLVPLLLGPILLFLILWATWLIHSMAHRHWQLAAVIIVLPVGAAILFAGMDGLGLTATYFEFRRQESHLSAEISKARERGDEASILAWSWGDTGWAGGSTVIYTLVYDASDTIARRSNEWPEDWRKRAERAANGNTLSSVLQPRDDSSLRIEDFGQHFYLIRQVF